MPDNYQRVIKALATICEVAEGKEKLLGGNMERIVPKGSEREFRRLAGNALWILGMTIESLEIERA